MASRQEIQDSDWAERVQLLAAWLSYPSTPDIATSTRRRLGDGGVATRPARLRAGLAAIIVLIITLAGLLMVPAVRAAIADVFRIGAVRIFRTAPADPTSQPSGGAAPTVVPLASLLDLQGSTTLDEARARVGFSLRLPQYPPGLGEPDAVFVQSRPGPRVIMAWSDPAAQGRVSLCLFEVSADAYLAKIEPKVIEETTVSGASAIWTEGPYMLVNRDGDIEFRRVVEGHALIWTDGEVTYRLETNLDLAEARRIAESLR